MCSKHDHVKDHNTFYNMACRQDAECFVEKDNSEVRNILILTNVCGNWVVSFSM